MLQKPKQVLCNATCDAHGLGALFQSEVSVHVTSVMCHGNQFCLTIFCLDQAPA